MPSLMHLVIPLYVVVITEQLLVNSNCTLAWGQTDIGVKVNDSRYAIFNHQIILTLYYRGLSMDCL